LVRDARPCGRCRTGAVSWRSSWRSSRRGSRLNRSREFQPLFCGFRRRANCYSWSWPPKSSVGVQMVGAR
jgi:hypothetical protein